MYGNFVLHRRLSVHFDIVLLRMHMRVAFHGTLTLLVTVMNPSNDYMHQARIVSNIVQSHNKVFGGVK